MTEAENRLWYFLRDRRFQGAKFRRQVPVGPYVVDFLCVPARLVVEADGGQHAERVAHDEERTRFLAAQGYRVVRFWNNEVMENIEGVMEVIGRELAACTLTPGGGLPSPSGRRVGDEGLANAACTLTPGPSPKGEGREATLTPGGGLPSPSGRRVGDEGLGDAMCTLTPGPSPKGEGRKATLTPGPSPKGEGRRETLTPGPSPKGEGRRA